jgi:phosphoribosyl-ATP pyrophosphohydrolase
MTADAASTDGRVLDALYAVIASRRGADPDTSWTAKLFARGRPKIAQKVGEEAVETVIEAMRGDSDAIPAEPPDLNYHPVGLWAAAGLRPAGVWAALEPRRGTSGVEEKRGRTTER